MHQQAVTGSRDGGLMLWSIATGMDLLVTFQHPASILTAAWRPDGEEILTGCEDGSIRIWPTSPEKVLCAMGQRIRALLSRGGARAPPRKVAEARQASVAHPAGRSLRILLLT
jgi:WD40 repeat protein